MLELITSTAGPYIAIGALALIALLSRKVQTIKYGKFEITTNRTGISIPLSMIDELEVRYFGKLTELIIYGQHGLLSDVRYRVRRNGWEKRADWDQYVKDAILSHRNRITEYLDIHYPGDALVTRLELFEHNHKMTRDVEERLCRMYNTMYSIFKDAHKRADELRASLKDHTNCSGNQGSPCNNIGLAMEVIKDIENLEGVGTRELCMNEAERALNEIARMYFSHYLTIYKTKKEESEKK